MAQVDAYVGQVMMFAGFRPPSGWLPCDGRTVQIQTYQLLAAVIGSLYGGDGRTNFKLPDFRGFFPTAPLTGQPGPRSGTAGLSQIQLTADNLPSHRHGATFAGTASTATANLGIQVKTVPGTAVPEDGGFFGQGSTGTGAANIFVAPGSAAPAATLNGGQATMSLNPAGTVVVEPAGGGQPVPLPLPCQTVLFCINYDGIFPQSD